MIYRSSRQKWKGVWSVIEWNWKGALRRVADEDAEGPKCEYDTQGYSLLGQARPVRTVAIFADRVQQIAVSAIPYLKCTSKSSP